jgi:hypothetical protein
VPSAQAVKYALQANQRRLAYQISVDDSASIFLTRRSTVFSIGGGFQVASNGPLGMTIAPGVEEIVRFLRRFADLMSTGHNADHLLGAANLIESLIRRADDSEGLLRAEQLSSQQNLQLYKSAEIARSNLEGELAEVKARLAELRSRQDETIVDGAAEKRRLLDRAEGAEAQLAAMESELAETRPRLAAFDNGHLLVPISILRHAEAQFEAIAKETADVVSQAMCEVGASTLDRLIVESAAQLSGRISEHAA